MSLADRLEQARRSHVERTRCTEHSRPAVLPAVPARASTPSPRSRRACTRPLIDSLGPQLYDPHLQQSELEQQVRLTLQSVIDAEHTPLSPADRTRIAQEVSDEILGHGPLEPLLRDPEVTEIMVNGPDHIYVERVGQLFPVDGAVHRRRAPAPRHRQDRRPGRPAHRRGQPDGRRPPARRLPRQRGHPADRARRLRCSPSASSPPDPFTDRDLIAFGTLHAAGARLPRGLRPRPAQHRHLRRHRLGKTTLLNVLSSLHPRRRAHRHHRGRRRAPAAPGARAAARVAPAQHRGPRPGRDPRPGASNSLRMRPDRIVVGEVRDGAALDMLQAMNTGHDGSITTVHANTPRDSLSRLETMVLMARRRPARPRHPRPGRRRDRPDRPAGPPQGRHPAGHRDHRGRRHGGRRHHPAGPVHLRLRGGPRRRRPLPRRASSPPACARSSRSTWPTRASSCPPSSSLSGSADDASSAAPGALGRCSVWRRSSCARRCPALSPATAATPAPGSLSDIADVRGAAPHRADRAAPTRRRRHRPRVGRRSRWAASPPCHGRPRAAQQPRGHARDRHQRRRWASAGMAARAVRRRGSSSDASPRTSRSGVVSFADAPPSTWPRRPTARRSSAAVAALRPRARPPSTTAIQARRRQRSAPTGEPQHHPAQRRWRHRQHGRTAQRGRRSRPQARRGIRAEVVAFKTDETQRAALKQLADAGGGSVAPPATVPARGSAFTAAARALASQVRRHGARARQASRGTQDVAVTGTAAAARSTPARPSTSATPPPVATQPTTAARRPPWLPPRRSQDRAAGADPASRSWCRCSLRSFAGAAMLVLASLSPAVHPGQSQSGSRRIERTLGARPAPRTVGSASPSAARRPAASS